MERRRADLHRARSGLVVAPAKGRAILGRALMGQTECRSLPTRQRSWRCAFLRCPRSRGRTARAGRNNVQAQARALVRKVANHAIENRIGSADDDFPALQTLCAIPSPIRLAIADQEGTRSRRLRPRESSLSSVTVRTVPLLGQREAGAKEAPFSRARA